MTSPDTAPCKPDCIHLEPHALDECPMAGVADFEARMGREHAAFLERVRTGDLRTVVATLREWSEVESVPAQDEFDLILARLEALASAYPRPKATPGYV